MENNNEYNEIKCTVIEGERLQFVTLDEWLRVEIKHGRITENEVEALRMDGKKYIEVGVTVEEAMEDIRHINERKEDKETNDVRDAIDAAFKESAERRNGPFRFSDPRPKEPVDIIQVSHHIAYPFPGSVDGDIYAFNKYYIDKMIEEHGAVAMLGPMETDYSTHNQIVFKQHATVFTAESTDEQVIARMLAEREEARKAREVEEKDAEKRYLQEVKAMKREVAAFLLNETDDDRIDWGDFINWLNYKVIDHDDCDYHCDSCGACGGQ